MNLKRAVFTVMLAALVASLAVAPSAMAVTPQIASNYTQSCLLNDVGSVFCAGDNSGLSLGDATVGKRAAFAAGPAIAGVTRLATGEDHVCALLSDSTVKCWGDNNTYQLGQGGAGTTDSATPLTVLKTGSTPLDGVAQLATQDATTCATRVDGTAWCWGSGSSGQIGDGSALSRSLATQVTGLTGVKKVVAGSNTSCALLSGGDVYCWGSDDDGELGDGDPAADSYTPVKTVGLTGVADIGVGNGFGCALIPGGSVQCWGSDSSGQQGNGNGTTANSAPAAVPGLSGVTKLAVGYNATCTLMADRVVVCWGDNDNNQSGPGSTADVQSPAAVPGAEGAIDIADQADYSNCALYRGGSIKCWGYNNNGELGIDNAWADVKVPTVVPGVDLVTLPYAAAPIALTQPVKTALDKKKKTYTVTTQLTATPNLLVATAEACTGASTLQATRTYYVKKTVKVKGKKVKKMVKKSKTYSSSGALTLVGENCVSTLSLKLSVKYFNGKKVKFTHSAAGNASLQPASATSTFKLPKVKAKKKSAKK